MATFFLWHESDFSRFVHSEAALEFYFSYMNAASAMTLGVYEKNS